MSQENVEVVRAFFEAWNAGNTDAVVELLDADVDYFPSRKLPEARPCHGPEEVLQFMARYLDAYSRHEWAIQEVIEVGGDRFLARVNLRVEGRDSGVKLEGDLYHCFWLRGGRFFRVEDHMTLSGALHALGLEGETLEAGPLGVGDVAGERGDRADGPRRRGRDDWDAVFKDMALVTSSSTSRVPPVP